MTDLELAQNICRKVEPHWTLFVQTYSDKVFYLANCWTSKERGQEYRKMVSRSGKIYSYSGTSLDTWMWIFERLQNKSCHYMGFNRANFNSYITAVMSGRYFFLDWLEWLYGDTSRIPVPLRSLNTSERKIFVGLRRGKSDEAVALELRVPIDKYPDLKKDVISKVAAAGLSHLILPPRRDYDEEVEEIPLSKEFGNDDAVDMNQFLDYLAGCLQSLEGWQRRLLILFYDNELSVDQILEHCRSGLVDLPQKEKESLSARRLYTLIDGAVRELFTKLCASYPEFVSELGTNAESLKKIFNEYGTENLKGKANGNEDEAVA